MSSLKNPAGGLAALALILVLAACGQVSANAPSPAPSQPTSPSPSEAPSEEPTPSPTPSPTPEPTQPPVATPDPTPIPILVHDVPMIARSTTEGVNVRVVPDLQASLLAATRYSDGATVSGVRLSEGEHVVVSMGPVFAGGHSWYEVRAVDGGETYWEFGWVSGQFLERVSDVPATDPIVANAHGVGQGSSASADVIAGTPVTVRFAARPVDGALSCDIDVMVIGTDGLGVNVATETLEDTRVYALSTFQLPSLFQEEAGTVRLDVTTDCTFAASMTMPPA